MNQSAHSDRQAELPDFRNLGVMLRILVIAEAANLLSLVAHAPDGFAALLTVANWGLAFEVAALGIVLSLFLLAPWLGRIPYRRAFWLVVGLSALLAAGFDGWMHAPSGEPALGRGLKATLMAALLAVLILFYFNWRQRILSPALAEARLMALQARIRPHFLFNSLNAAVSVVRDNPRLAERVLLDMCDLFRALLAEGRSLVPLEDEIRLARSYLEIECLRLGERLEVVWAIDDVPVDTCVPVLLLQPLLENAVYHGIELRPEGGTISVRIGRKGRMLVIEVRNPVSRGGVVPPGNRIALANIRERLSLHFDAEALLHASARGAEFVVSVTIPLVRPERAPDGAR